MNIGTDIYGVAALAKNTDNVETLITLSEKYSHIFPILSSLLMNENLPSHVLEKIYFEHDDKEIMLRTVLNPNVSEKIVNHYFEQLPKNHTDDIFNHYRSIIINILENASSWKQVETFSQMLEQIFTPMIEQQLKKLAHPQSIISVKSLQQIILTGQVMNPHTPSHVIQKNYHTMLEQTVVSSGQPAQFFYHIATHENTPQHILEQLCETTPLLWIKTGLTRNPNTPFDALMCDNIWLNIGDNSEELVNSIINRSEFNEQFQKYFIHSDKLNKISAKVLLQSGKLSETEKALLVLQYGSVK